MVDYIRSLWPEEIPYWIKFDLDGRIVLFTVLLTALTTIVIGLDNRSPVTEVPLGLVYLCLLISSVGMAALVAHSMWRQLAGRMTRDELAPGAAAAAE